MPSFWPIKAFWIVAEGGAGASLVLALGVVVHLALLAALLRRFRSVLHRP